jgi:hypothetical protein
MKAGPSPPKMPFKAPELTAVEIQSTIEIRFEKKI